MWNQLEKTFHGKKHWERLSHHAVYQSITTFFIKYYTSQYVQTNIFIDRPTKDILKHHFVITIRSPKT